MRIGWIDTDKELPKSCEHLMLYIVDKNNPHWWRVVNGSYHSRFYAHDGLDDNKEYVAYWQKLYFPPSKI